MFNRRKKEFGQSLSASCSRTQTILTHYDNQFCSGLSLRVCFCCCELHDTILLLFLHFLEVRKYSLFRKSTIKANIYQRHMTHVVAAATIQYVPLFNFTVCIDAPERQRINHIGSALPICIYGYLDVTAFLKS